MKSFQIFCDILILSLIIVFCDKIKFAIAKVSDGRCGAPERCCTGRDSSCFVNSGDNSLDDNGLISFDNSISEPCYCDEGCLETGDCCSDYEAICTFEGNIWPYFISSMIRLSFVIWESNIHLGM